VAPVAAAQQRRELGDRILLPVIQLVGARIAPKELVLGLLVSAEPGDQDHHEHDEDRAAEHHVRVVRRRADREDDRDEDRTADDRERAAEQRTEVRAARAVGVRRDWFDCHENETCGTSRSEATSISKNSRG
jgi:hypothetical protein